MDGESIGVTRSVVLPLSEVTFRFSRSSGPGGQHAQKTESRVEAVFDVEASAALSPAQKRRGGAQARPAPRAGGPGGRGPWPDPRAGDPRAPGRAPRGAGRVRAPRAPAPD